MTEHEHQALTAAAHTRPGYATYPPRTSRQPTPPAVLREADPLDGFREVLREHLPAIGEALTAALVTPRRSFWHRVLQALARR